jgi:hypothetical protein
MDERLAGFAELSGNGYGFLQERFLHIRSAVEDQTRVHNDVPEV